MDSRRRTQHEHSALAVRIRLLAVLRDVRPGALGTVVGPQRYHEGDELEHGVGARPAVSDGCDYADGLQPKLRRISEKQSPSSTKGTLCGSIACRPKSLRPPTRIAATTEPHPLHHCACDQHGRDYRKGALVRHE